MAAIPQSPDGRFVVALIATRGRFDLLARRALASVRAQARLPDRVLVIVDQAKDELPDAQFAEHVRELRSACGSRVPLTVLRNRRTRPSAPGAWNTGLDQLHRDTRVMAQRDLWFVAVLDDDDVWDPDHLRLCIDAAVRGDLHLVAAGLVRHETADDAGHRHSIPPGLDPREQFIRGQHIQGSNLFLRLDLFLQVGGFDERLPSCTDRDLCIRIAALDGVRFGRVEAHTVHHFADARQDRLSARSSPWKLDGLTRFWRKHADRFDANARAEAAQRARELFGWTPEEPARSIAVVPPPEPPPRAMSFVVGFVTDARVRPHVSGLLADLSSLAATPGVASLHVVVVENGPLPPAGERTLPGLVREFQERGLSAEFLTIEQQRADWAEGRLPDTPDPTAGRLPIAVTRTILSTYVARRALERPGAAAWILDDDKRLRVAVDRGDGVLVERVTPDVAALCALRDAGVHVVLGPDTDAAPLPFVATLRTQLVDLEHLLGVLQASAPDSIWPDRRARTSANRRDLQDSYYDLARSTAHLETPFHLAPQHGGFTATDALAFAAEKAGRLLAGEAPLRPLVIDAADLPPDAARDSVQRGGSAIFFDPQHLLAFPHTLARFGDTYVRRSDMLVSQLQRDQLGLRIVMHPAAAVRHDRSSTKAERLGGSALRLDVLGYALYRTASELMAARSPEGRRGPLIAWSANELRSAVRLVRKYLTERLAALTLNAWRILGLAGAVRRAAASLRREGSAWDRPEHRAHLDRIACEMDAIAGQFRWSAVRAHADDIAGSVTDADIRGAFASMDGLVSEYHACHPADSAAAPAVAAAREARAGALVRAHMRTRDLRLLGMGGEGVVLTDGIHVYKVLDLLKRRPNHETFDVLRDLTSRLDEPRHLCALTRVERHDETVVVVYPHEPSEPYTDGRGADLVGLLRECKRHGIVFRNMHPKNLRVFGGTVRLIDYGSDIRPYSDAGYRTMAERAWLCWRWSHRPDLDQIMRRALVDRSLPELQGFDRFWRAVCDEQPSATATVAALVDPIVLASGAKRVLDYGCGKHPRSVRHLAAAALSVVGFDPSAEAAAHWARQSDLPGSARLTTTRDAALASGPFDAVLCSMVLCEVADGPGYEQILDDLRAAAGSDGLVLVTICNPLAAFGPPTPLHTARHLPEGADYAATFTFTEHAETGSPRTEIHRPLRRIERDLLRHGLAVERRIESGTVDLLRFEPASDFLVLVCHPVPGATPGTAVSLVIKTCAMEAATIERQVGHLVRQLEGPRAFAERVLAIDARRDGFLRQHARGDPEALDAAVERLVEAGLIDRVVRGPAAGPESREVLRSWFAVESDASHTTAGVPLAMPLHAIATCTSDYVFQVDSDLLVGRTDRSHDYLGEMVAALEGDPSAVSVSLNVPREGDRPFSAGAEPSRPWRIEVRGCLLHRGRLMAGRPYPNELADGVPALPWYRSLDRAVLHGRFRSLRGGGRGTWFVHVPNECKRDAAAWMLLLDLVEKGHLNPAQIGKVDLAGGALQWIRGRRPEPLVFVVTGRNVPGGRMRRCVESLQAQHGDWGAVVIDDGSDEAERTSLALALEPLGGRVTLLQPRERRGQLANLALAIRHVCADPDAVIVTLDLDDELLGREAAARVLAEHRRGADVTVGSMLRTDKHAEYPVAFSGPRSSRGGNCWQHLRSFRKRLFDGIPDHELRIGREYAGIAVDWAFMIPIVEMASEPVWVREPLYLYEPSGMGKGADRATREQEIGAILAHPPRTRAGGARRAGLLRADDIDEGVWGEGGGVLFLRHAERPSFAGLDDAGRDDVPLTPSGRATALELGRTLGRGVAVASSPLGRAVETAASLLEAIGDPQAEIHRLPGLVEFRPADRALYAAAKARLGWSGLMSEWTSGLLSGEVILPCEEVALRAITSVLDATRSDRIVAVTHDFMIIALLAALRGERVTYVPFLAGVFVGREEIRRFTSGRSPS